METTKSADGTVIAYDRAGRGPALIIALGAFCDRKTFVPPADLTARFTVYTYDRRGRGDSGDTRPYSPGREVEDLAAVIEAAGGGSGGGGAGSGGGAGARFGGGAGARPRKELAISRPLR
jgi:pimeloyl-ACP methyl ester carboxylesterase